MALLITGATGHLGPHLLAEVMKAAEFDRVHVAARSTDKPAQCRVVAVEQVAQEILSSRGERAGRVAVLPIDSDRFALDAAGLRGVRREVTVVVHAAADTRFAAPLDALTRANVDTTLAMCRFAHACPRLRQFLFVSTACVAGRRTGTIPERLTDASAGFANAYQQTKWEAEQIVAGSGLPARIARLSICAGSHVNGYVHRFGAVHHLLHWISRGLVPMMPGTAQTTVDLLSTDVAAAWLARAAARHPQRVDVSHVALGSRAIRLEDLLDFLIPLLNQGGRGRVQRPMLVDEAAFDTFNRMVRSSGDALFARVQESAAAVLPSLLHPKVYDTTSAERCWNGPLPHPDWRVLVERVVVFGRMRGWGVKSRREPAHA